MLGKVRNPLGFVEFTRSLGANWLTLMSGPLSVPAALLSLWLSNDAAKIAAGATAFICVWITAFILWRSEREQKQALQYDLGPVKLREIEAQEAHTQALERQTKAIEAQNRDNDPFVKMVRERQTEWLKPGVLALEVGETGPFYSTTGSGLHDIKRTFNVKITNVHPYTTATNCKVHVIKIEPEDNEYKGPWLLKEISSLAAGDHDFIPLARYGEARNPKDYNCADTFFTTFFGSPGHPAFDINHPYIFTLRATAVNSPRCEFRCKLWVDEDGRFRIEKA
jgi:hypothetical protein